MPHFFSYCKKYHSMVLQEAVFLLGYTQILVTFDAFHKGFSIAASSSTSWCIWGINQLWQMDCTLLLHFRDVASQIFSWLKEPSLLHHQCLSDHFLGLHQIVLEKLIYQLTSNIQCTGGCLSFVCLRPGSQRCIGFSCLWPTDHKRGVLYCADHPLSGAAWHPIGTDYATTHIHSFLVGIVLRHSCRSGNSDVTLFFTGSSLTTALWFYPKGCRSYNNWHVGLPLASWKCFLVLISEVPLPFCCSWRSLEITTLHSAGIMFFITVPVAIRPFACRPSSNLTKVKYLST